MSIGLIDECRRLFRLFKLRSRLVVELLRSLRFAWNWARSSGEIELNRRPDKLEELAAREMLLLSTVGELDLVIGWYSWYGCIGQSSCVERCGRLSKLDWAELTHKKSKPIKRVNNKSIGWEELKEKKQLKFMVSANRVDRDNYRFSIRKSIQLNRLNNDANGP